jgi:hypothetical protein
VGALAANAVPPRVTKLMRRNITLKIIIIFLIILRFLSVFHHVNMNDTSKEAEMG